MQETVKLNVGGRRFLTSRSTIDAAGPASMLVRMIELDASETLHSMRDEKGYIFIDRDGSSFEVVLNVLRTGRLLPPVGANLSLIHDELRFYGT